MHVDDIVAQLKAQDLEAPAEAMTVLAEHAAAAEALTELNLKEPVLLGKLRLLNQDTTAKLKAAADHAVETDAELAQLRAEQARLRSAEATGTSPDGQWDQGLRAAWASFPDARESLAALDERRMQAGRQQITAELPARLVVVQMLTDPELVAREWSEVAVGGHPTAIRSLGRVVESRLTALAASERAGVRATAERVGREFRQQFRDWATQHPTSLAQIERLDERAANRERQIRSGVRWAASFAGLAERTPQVVT